MKSPRKYETMRLADLRRRRVECEREFQAALRQFYDTAATSLSVQLDPELRAARDHASYSLGRLEMAGEMVAMEQRALKAVAADSTQRRRVQSATGVRQ